MTDPVKESPCLERMVDAVIVDRAKRRRGCRYTSDAEERERVKLRRDLRVAITVLLDD